MKSVKSINDLKQGYEPAYKSKKFKTEKDFDVWLKKIARYKIVFKDVGQDCLEWFIDKRGEVIHSKFQASVWNGGMVDLFNLEIGKEIGVMEPFKMRTRFYDFIVEEIIKLK